MFGLSHLFFVVDVVSIFAYHSTRPSNNDIVVIVTAMTTILEIIINQKTRVCFFLLLSISCCFCVCLSISLMTSVSNPCLGLCCLFLVAIYCCSFFCYCWFEIEGVSPERHSGPPNRLIILCNFLLSVIRVSFSSFCIT